MASNRYRRIVRRAVLVAVGAVLLPASYLGSVASLAYAVNARLVPAGVETSAVTKAYVTPVVWYVNHSELPGAEFYEAVIRWSCEAGKRAQQ